MNAPPSVAFAVGPLLALGKGMPDSPFHHGERLLQERAQVRDRMERFGSRVIRPALPEQHREFYGLLPFLVIGAVDPEGRPWASLLAGPPGFVSSPTPTALRVAAEPDAGDPIRRALVPGARAGVLGIDPATRRRNRVNGRLVANAGEGLALRVEQSFGNCPQYIHQRRMRPGLHPAEPQWSDATLGDEAVRAWIHGADTFFIASSWDEDAEDPTHGVDVSHRGGRPGFVRVEDDGALLFPDFSGNNHFNTLGNLLMNPRCGLVFADFVRGDLLSLTGRAEVFVDHPDLPALRGAQRIVRVEIDGVRVGRGTLPFVYEDEEPWPLAVRTGVWSDVAAG